MKIGEKNQHKTNALPFFGGLFLVLLSLCLFINVGVVARALSVPFLFFLGIGSYLLYIFMFVSGFSLMFRKKALFFKKARHIISSIIFLIALLVLVSFIYVKCGANQMIEDNPFINVANLFNDVYFSSKTVGVFSVTVPVGGGIIGYSLLTIFNRIGEGASIAFIVTLFVISLLIAFLKPFICSLKHKKKEKLSIRKKYEEKENSIFDKEPDVVDISLNDYENDDIEVENNEPEIENIGPISREEMFPQPESIKIEEHTEYAPKVEEGLASSISPNPIKPVSFNNDVNGNNMSFHSLSDNGVKFARPEFGNKMIKNDEPLLKPITPEIKEVTEQPIASISDVKDNYEQIELEFGALKPSDEEMALASTKIDFTEPVAVKTSDSISAEIASGEKPVEVAPSEKKERPKINWIAPSTELLNVYETSNELKLNEEVAESRKVIINSTFENFHIGAQCIGYTIGSSVTRYHIECNNNVSVKTVASIMPDISVRIGGIPVRFTQIVEGQIYSGLEIPNAATTTVGFKEVMESLPDVKKHPLAVGFGKDISGKLVSADLNEFPHLLVAGTTGSGKSIFIHSIIATLIMRASPDLVRIVLVDPKKVEMTKYRDMPHLLCPIITEASKAKVMLSKLVQEMEDRYSSFEFADGSSNIGQYNEWAEENNKEKLPYIIVILDEYADLVDTCKEISQPVVSIAQKARAAGIHLVISTQRPSTNVITGVIKGNLPTRVALMTSSYVDSNTIVGEAGAEKLLGKGDMLVQSPLVSRTGMVRLQGCFISNKEIVRVVGYLKEHYETYYDENYMDLVDHSKEAGLRMVREGNMDANVEDGAEAKYQSVKEWVMTLEYVSMSKIQRECSVGFNRAGIFFKRLREEGVVADSEEGNKGSRVLIHDKFSSYDEPVNSSELISRKNDYDY